VVGRQDVQHRGGILRLCQKQIVGTGTQHTVCTVSDHTQDRQRPVGLCHRAERGPHFVYEDHIEDAHIAHSVLDPKLVIAEPGWACVGDDGGGDEGKNAPGEEPKIGDVKESLGFAYHHITGENSYPAAHGKRQMVHGVRRQLGHANQPPEIGEFRQDHKKRQKIPQSYIPLAAGQPVPETADQKNDAYSKENRCQMGDGEIGEFHLCALPKEIFEECLHSGNLLIGILLLYIF